MWVCVGEREREREREDCLRIRPMGSVTRLDDFLKMLNSRFSFNSGQNKYDFLGSLGKQHFLSKSCFG